MKPIQIELPTGLEVGPVNAYLFPEPEPVLVDTGLRSEASWTALEEGLATQGLTVADIERVVITHPHVDHCGQAGAIAANSEAEIWIADLGLPWLLNFPAMWAKRLAYYRQVIFPRAGLDSDMAELILTNMAALAATVESLPPGRLNSFGLNDTLILGGEPWQVIHAPGHASMQTCFYQPDRGHFLSADMLLALAPMPIVERPAEGMERVPGLPQFLDSLERVEALDIGTVYPGHGQPFTDHRALIKRQRDRIQMRKRECLSLIESGYHTIGQMVNSMYGEYPPQFRFAGVWMLIGYLDLLKGEGLVEEQLVDGVWHYHLKGEEKAEVGVDLNQS